MQGRYLGDGASLPGRLAFGLVALTGCLPDRYSDAELTAKIDDAAYLASCREQVECALDAACVGDAACVEACSEGAPAAIAGQAGAVLSCRSSCIDRVCKGATGAALANCEAQCLLYQCTAEVLACAAPLGAGSAICPDMIGCLGGCEPIAGGERMECAAGCADSLAAAEISATSKLAACMSNAGAAGKSVGSACGAELAGCYAGGVTGTGLCHEAFLCQELCKKQGKSDEVCTRECLATLTLTAQTQYVGYLQCLTDSKGQLAPCNPALISCASPAGPASCQVMFDETKKCIQKNGTAASGSCIAGALHGGKPGAAGPYLDLLLCYTADCAQTCEKTPAACAGCVTTKCGGKQVACTKAN